MMSEFFSMGTIRGLLTLVLLLAFLGMVRFVYSKRNRGTYDYAAQLPLEEAPTNNEAQRS